MTIPAKFPHSGGLGPAPACRVWARTSCSPSDWHSLTCPQLLTCGVRTKFTVLFFPLKET